MSLLLQDVKFGARVLWKDRVFAVTAILTLAVCIGANTALFTIVRSVLFRPLPYPEPERIVTIYDSFPNAGVERAGTSVPNYYDRLELEEFDSQALYATRGRNVGKGAAAERVRVMEATPSLFQVLRAKPYRGRVFSEEENDVGNTRRLILSYGFWQRNFGGDESAVGRNLIVDGESYSIVGIMPADFAFLDPDVQLWLPLAFTPEQRAENRRYSQNQSEVARLKPGAAIELAQQKIDALNVRNLERAGPLKDLLVNTGYHSVVVGLQNDLVRNVRRSIYLLWGGVLFVLLIAAVNITNLVLVRSSGRLKELATRRMLGAGHWRTARQLLTETALLTVASGILGLVLGGWSIRWLSSLGMSELPRGHEIHMDGTVVAFTIGLALLLALVISAVPVAQLAGMDLNSVLHDDSRTGTAGRGARLFRRVLVGAQVALAFVLLIGAGLLLASFRQMLATDPGFRSDHVLTGLVSMPGVRYRDDASLRGFTDRVLQRVRALPGVEAAGATSSLPFSGSNSSSVILAEGYVMAPGESAISPNIIRATPGYFEAMRIPLVRGRYFTDADTGGAPKVVVVDERLARKFWPDSDPVGRRMFMPSSPQDLISPGPDARWMRVVGVVKTVKLQGIVEGEGARLGAYYFPYAQDTTRGIGLAIRTGGDPGTITSAVRQVIAQEDPELPFFDIQPMQERITRSLDSRRLPMLIAVAFAAVALLLAAVGIYGVLAYQVSQRTREIGIRLALGSDGETIFRMILSEGAVLVGAGLAVGAAGAVALRQAIVSQLYGVQPLDPLVLAAVTAILGAAALGACVAPARRATRVDPIVALNEQ